MSFPGAVTLGKFVYSTSYRPLWQVGGKYATHIINPHNLVVTALAIFWVCRDDKFMASRDFNLQGYNVIGVWVDRMDNIHLRHPASNQYEFQALSEGSAVGLEREKTEIGSSTCDSQYPMRLLLVCHLDRLWKLSTRDIPAWSDA